MTLVAFATAIVCGCLWALDQLHVFPAGQLRTRLTRPFLVIVVVAMFAIPTAWRSGFDWFIERKTNELVNRIQPAIDELTPSPTTPVNLRRTG